MGRREHLRRIHSKLVTIEQTLYHYNYDQIFQNLSYWNMKFSDWIFPRQNRTPHEEK